MGKHSGLPPRSRQSPRIPVAVGVHVRTLKEVVLRHLTVPRHARDRARQTSDVPRQRKVLRRSDRVIEVAVGLDGDAARLMC
jgi:hypothetical protein